MAYKYDRSLRSPEDVARRSKQSAGGYDSYIQPAFSMYKPKEGENVIRIMPPTWNMKSRAIVSACVKKGGSVKEGLEEAIAKDKADGEELRRWGMGWEVSIHTHWGIGADKAAYLCPYKILGEECAICEARSNAADNEEAAALKPGWRGLVWLIDRKDEKAGPQWWAMPAQVFSEINGRSQDKKTGEIFFVDDPEEGYDVTFNRQGTKRNTDYTGVELDREPSPLSNSDRKFDDWMDYIEENPLPSILNFYPNDYIEKVLYARVEKRSRAGEEEVEEDTSSRRRGRRSAEPEEEEVSTRRSRRSEPEEEKAEAPSRRRRSEPEEEQEEDTRSRRTRSEEAEEEEVSSSRRRRSAPEEDEEPPFDKDEEKGEAEEKPRASTRRRASKDEDEGEGEEAEESTAAQGRRALGRLKGRR